MKKQLDKRPYSYQVRQLLGTINYAYLDTSNSKLWKDQPFYVLEIENKNWLGKTKETIYVFANLVDKEVWSTLEQQTFKGKKYLFFCEKRVRGWRLKKWEGINQIC